MFKKSLWFFVITGFIFSSNAFAGKRNIKFKEDKSLKVNKAELIRKAKAEKEKAKRTIRYEDFIQLAKRSQDIKLPILKRLIRRLKGQLRLMRKSDKRRVEYMFRLADVYIQLEEIYKFKHGETIEKISSAKSAAKRRKYIKYKAAYMRLQKKYLEAALVQLNAITTNKAFANWHRMDEVLFKLGDIARELGYQDIMQEKFRKLLRNYPQSKFVPNVHLAFAEFYFKKGRAGLRLATTYYLKVVNNKAAKNTPVFFYAHRMLGWCYFNMQRFARAQSEFLFVAQKAKRKILRAQARNEVVMAYSFQGKRELAYNFFKHQLGSKYAKDLYLRLAKEYFSQGNMKNMIWVYNDMIKRFPRDPQRCEWMKEVYLGYKLDQLVVPMASTLDNIVKTMKDLKKQYGEKKLEYRMCRDFAKRALYDQAKRWYLKVDKGKAKELSERKQLMLGAAKLYQRFLEEFPNVDDAYDMRYDYSQLLGDLATLYEQETRGRDQAGIRERYKRAAKEYSVLLRWNKIPKGMSPAQFAKNREDIGHATVYYWMKVLNVDFQRENKRRNKQAQDYLKRRNCLKAKKKAEAAGKKWRRKCPEFKKNFPIPGELKNVISIFGLYVKYVKTGKLLPKIKFNRAMIYYMYRHFNEAIPLFKDTVLTSYKTDPRMALQAALYLMIAYDAEDRFEDMVETITELLKPQYQQMFTISPQAKKFRAQLEKKKLENLELEVAKRGEEGRYAEAGNMLISMAREYKMNPAKVIQYYNSAYIAYEKAGMIGLAIRALKEMMYKYGDGPYKNNKYVVDANLKVGTLFEKIAMFTRAAAAYEAFFKKYPRDPDAVKAARRAVKLYWWSGNLKKANAKAREFITRLHAMGARKFRGDMAAMFFMLHQFFEGRNEGKVLHFLTKYVETMRRSGANDLMIRVLAKRGQYYWNKSCPVPTHYGICMKIVYETKKSKTDTWKVAVVKFVPRKRNLVKLAAKNFNMAVKLYNRWKGSKTTLGAKGAEHIMRVNKTLDAVAMSKFYLGEASYEDIISMELPMLKAKTPKELKKSLLAIRKWVKKQTKLMSKTKKLYEEVAKIKLGKKRKKNNSWYVPAAGRFGAIYKNFATRMANIKFGKSIERNIDAKLQIKDTLAKSYEKFEDIAKQGFQACVKKAQKTGRYDEWYEFCEKELAELRHSVSPISDELWPKPKYQKPECSKPTVMTVPLR